MAIPMALGYSSSSEIPAIPMAIPVAIPMAPVVFSLLAVTSYPYGYSYGYPYGSWGVSLQPMPIPISQ
jgi:hypothetical protein